MTLRPDSVRARLRQWVAALIAVVAIGLLMIGAYQLWRKNDQSAASAVVTSGTASASSAGPSQAGTPSLALSTPADAAAIVPFRLTAPSTSGHGAIDTYIIAKPMEVAHDPWLGRDVPSFGIPEADDRDPRTDKPIGQDGVMWYTSWWSDGPKVGARGNQNTMSVILGHTQIGGPGVFNELGAFQVGDGVSVSDKQGAVMNLRTVKVASGLSKSDPAALNGALVAAPPEAVLALITCSGPTGNPGNAGLSSQENTVVFLARA